MRVAAKFLSGSETALVEKLALEEFYQNSRIPVH